MIRTLANNRKVIIRQLQSTEADVLFNYLQQLSPESRSRFGPHAFDKETIHTICENLSPGILRYISKDAEMGCIVAYMLIKQGMIEWDKERYAARNQFFDLSTTVTFAPSVADAWQRSGLGTVMNSIIENELINRGIKTIVLWGGVQASNEKAVNFYKKHNYRYISSFWHEGKDNYDMVKDL